MRSLTWLLPVSAIILLSGCSSTADELDPARENYEYVVVGAEPTTPEGVVRYCWEEPIADYEAVSPGVDSEGKWYYPSHIAVRQVRGGRWRPCEKMPSEVKGETRNER